MAVPATKLLREVLEALENVPEVGEVFDQQHADTQMRAILKIRRELDRREKGEEVRRRVAGALGIPHNE